MKTKTMVLVRMPNISTKPETACLFSGLNKCASFWMALWNQCHYRPGCTYQKDLYLLTILINLLKIIFKLYLIKRLTNRHHWPKLTRHKVLILTSNRMSNTQSINLDKFHHLWVSNPLEFDPGLVDLSACAITDSCHEPLLLSGHSFPNSIWHPKHRQCIQHVGIPLKAGKQMLKVRGISSYPCSVFFFFFKLQPHI